MGKGDQMSEDFFPYSEYRESRCELGMLPSGWGEIKFRFLFSTIKGKIPDQVLPHQEEGAIPYVSMEYLRDGEIGGFVVPNSKSIVLENNQIMILWDGSNSGEILKTKHGVLSSTAALLVPKHSEHDFNYYCLKAMEPIIKSGNTGMGIPHVNGEFLKNVILPWPPLDERKKIADFLNKKLSLIGKVLDNSKNHANELKGEIFGFKSQISQFEEYKSALITAAISGKIDLRDYPLPEDTA